MRAVAIFLCWLLPITGIHVELFNAVSEGEKMARQQEREERQREREYKVRLKEAFGYIPTDEEINLAKRICMAEGGNTEPTAGLVAIFCVIRNRVKSDRFPNSIEEVLYQRYQFDTVTTGRIWNYTVNYVVDDAWGLFLANPDIYEDVVFFTAGDYNPYCTPAFKLGNHYFGR